MGEKTKELLIQGAVMVAAVLVAFQIREMFGMARVSPPKKAD